MTDFVLLWAKMLDSSIWIKETPQTRCVWVTMLMMKDRNGFVHASKIGLTARARVDREECEEALRVLMSPDSDDTSGVDGGRRIREVQGGWQIINSEYYRYSTDEKREYERVKKERQRATLKQGGARKPKKVAKPSACRMPSGRAYQMVEEAGASPAQLEALQDEQP